MFTGSVQFIVFMSKEEKYLNLYSVWQEADDLRTCVSLIFISCWTIAYLYTL